MNKQHSICLLNDSFPPLVDGVANVMVNYAEQFLKHGFHPVVITPSHPQADDRSFAYPILRYPSIDLRKQTGYMAGFPFSPEVAHQVSKGKVSILHSHCPIVSTLMARELRQITDAPLVLTYHTKYDIDIANTIQSNALQISSKKALLNNINACDEVWTVSQGAGENLRMLGYEGDYTVMPNGVDLPRGRVDDDRIAATTGAWQFPECVPTYLFVGRLMWYKGIRIILDALAALKHEGLPFRMVFIGDGADRKAIEQYALDAGISEWCYFTGTIVEREFLRAWYCKADLFLFPSTFDTNGLVVREAAACSLPSVLIRGSAAAEGITDHRNGYLIDENPESLNQLLRNCRISGDKVRSVGETASQELYISWEESAAKVLEQYQMIDEKNRRGVYTRRHNASEKMLRLNGELMEGLGNIRHAVKRHTDHKGWV